MNSAPSSNASGGQTLTANIVSWMILMWTFVKTYFNAYMFQPFDNMLVACIMISRYLSSRNRLEFAEVSIGHALEAG